MENTGPWNGALQLSQFSRFTSLYFDQIPNSQDLY